MQRNDGKGDYLRRCLREFPEICRLKYGAPFDPAAIEEKVRHLRCRTTLACADLAHFESPDLWWFRRFWVFPPRQQIEPALEGTFFDFWNLPESNEPETVLGLLHVFKSIELVALILRFARPEHYAIYSAPIQHILDIRHGRDLVQTYLAYLENLRELKSHHYFERVADMDMALWVLHEKCYGKWRDHEIEAAYREDDFILQLRVGNLVAPLAALSEARLARALAGVKPGLASLIACHQLEILLRKLAGQLRLCEIEDATPLEEVIDRLPHFGPVGPMRKALWKSLKSIRNDLIHNGRQPGPQETRLLLHEVGRLETEIDTGAFARTPAHP
jgi:hypothetical protein